MKLYNLRVVSPLNLKKSVVDELKKKGKSKDKPDSAYDAEQLKMGIKVEMEHGLGAAAAKEIAKDHLEEIADYYTRLDKMESSAKKSLPDLEKSDADVEAATKHPNKLGAGAKKRKKLRGQDKVHAVMKEFYAGTLHSSSGEIVTSKKQALAIAMSEAGLSKKSMDEYLDTLEKGKGGAAKTMRDKDYAKVKGGKKKNFKSAANSRENAKFAKEQRKAAGYDTEKSRDRFALVLTKGKKMAVGTIATWKGVRYQKVSEGSWKPVPKKTQEERQIAHGEKSAREAVPIKKDIGGEYRVSEGSGTASNQRVKVIKDFDWKEEQGAYKTPGKDWVAVQFASGEKRYLPANRLFKQKSSVSAKEVAHAAGADVAQRKMTAEGRTKWNKEDYNAAVRERNRLMDARGGEGQKVKAAPAKKSRGIPVHSTEEATVTGVTAQIKKFAKLPLKKLRQYQSIQDQQMQMVYENKTISEDRKAQLTELLQMRRNIYTAAVSVQSFKDKAENWADNIVEEGKQSKAKWEEFKAKRASEKKD